MSAQRPTTRKSVSHYANIQHWRLSFNSKEIRGVLGSAPQGERGSRMERCMTVRDLRFHPDLLDLECRAS